MSARISPALLRRLAIALGVGGGAAAMSSDADAIPLGPRARTAIPAARELALEIERSLLAEHASRAGLPDNWREVFDRSPGLLHSQTLGIREALRDAAHKAWDETGQRFGQPWSRVNSLNLNSPWRFEAPDTGFEVQLSRYLGDESPLPHRVRHPALEAAHPERFRNTTLQVMRPDARLQTPSGVTLDGVLAYAAEPWSKGVMTREMRLSGKGVIGFAPSMMKHIVPPPIVPGDLRVGGKHHDTTRALLLHELTHRFNADIPNELKVKPGYLDRFHEQMAFRAQHSLTMNNAMRRQTPFGLRPLQQISDMALQRGASRPRDIPDIANYAKRIKSDYTDMIDKELPYWPGVDVSYEMMGGGHIKAILTYNGKSRFITLPKTGSDHRGPLNSRRDMRRVLLELGAMRVG